MSPITYVRSIVASPAEPACFYATLSVRSGGNTGTIWRSTDAGTSWSRFDQGITPDSTMMAVAAHHANPKIVCALTYSGQVFATIDGGHSWRSWQVPSEATEGYAIACL